MKRDSLLLLCLSSFVVLFMCCSKSDDEPNDDTEKPLTKKEMLVKNTWQVAEVLRNIDGTNSHYVKDGINTTGTNYGLIRLTFNTDGTGTYVDEVGTTHQTKWSFTTSDERNMYLEVGAPYATNFTWNLVEISEASFSNTAAVGTSVLVAARYIPVPKQQ